MVEVQVDMQSERNYKMCNLACLIACLMGKLNLLLDEDNDTVKLWKVQSQSNSVLHRVSYHHGLGVMEV